MGNVPEEPIMEPAASRWRVLYVLALDKLQLPYSRGPLPSSFQKECASR